MKCLVSTLFILSLAATAQQPPSLPPCGYNAYPCINAGAGPSIIANPADDPANGRPAQQQTQNQECQNDKILWEQHHKGIFRPGCAELRKFAIQYEQQQTAQQSLVALFNGPDGKKWLEAYAWAKSNGCQAKRIPFHPHKTRQAQAEYERTLSLLPADEYKRVLFLCGR